MLDFDKYLFSSDHCYYFNPKLVIATLFRMLWALGVLRPLQTGLPTHSITPNFGSQVFGAQAYKKIAFFIFFMFPPNFNGAGSSYNVVYDVNCSSGSNMFYYF